jgi:hypothetical protein
VIYNLILVTVILRLGPFTSERLFGSQESLALLSMNNNMAITTTQPRLDIPKFSAIEELVPNIRNEPLSLYDLLPEDLRKQMEESRNSRKLFAKRRITMGESASQGEKTMKE